MDQKTQKDMDRAVKRLSATPNREECLAPGVSPKACGDGAVEILKWASQAAARDAGGAALGGGGAQARDARGGQARE